MQAEQLIVRAGRIRCRISVLFIFVSKEVPTAIVQPGNPSVCFKVEEVELGLASPPKAE